MSFRERAGKFARNGIVAGVIAGAGIGSGWAVHEGAFNGAGKSNPERVNIEADQKYFADFELNGIKFELSSIEEIPNTSLGMKLISIHGTASKSPNNGELSGVKMDIASGKRAYPGTVVIMDTDSSSAGPVDFRINTMAPEDFSGERLELSISPSAQERTSDGVGDSSQVIPLSKDRITPVPATREPERAQTK